MSKQRTVVVREDAVILSEGGQILRRVPPTVLIQAMSAQGFAPLPLLPAGTRWLSPQRERWLIALPSDATTPAACYLIACADRTYADLTSVNVFSPVDTATDSLANWPVLHEGGANEVIAEYSEWTEDHGEPTGLAEATDRVLSCVWRHGNRLAPLGNTTTLGELISTLSPTTGGPQSVAELFLGLTS